MRLRSILLGLPLGALAFSVFGCFTLSLHPKVYVDSTFRDHPGEWAEIQAALDSWEDAGVGITFDRQEVAHATGGMGKDTIVIIRNEGPHDQACPWEDGGIKGTGDKDVGKTWNFENGNGAGICIDAQWSDANPDCSIDGTITLRTVAVHELGHALKLSHDLTERRSAMHPACGEDWGAPTCVDLDQLASLWPGIVIPDFCISDLSPDPGAPADAGE